MDYKKKYFKYKNKYLKIKKMLGGSDNYEILEDLQEEIQFILPTSETIRVIEGQPPENLDDSDHIKNFEALCEDIERGRKEAEEEAKKEDAEILATFQNTVSIIAVIGGIVGLVFLTK